MSLGTMVLYIAIVSLIATIGVGVLKKGQIKWVLSFLQNFCGILFIFSGYVKAIDPMGTAFKMEQYFAEFEATFSGTWFGFLSPLFPWLSEHAIGFSVFMIVLEIVVGIMLVIGHKPKFTAWVFLITLIFFTILTGFTFLTGYVPSGSNFFAFGSWGPYDVSNMRVTDCGCFGDFVKLEPRTSFFKDIFLLVPSIWFVLRWKKMHELFTNGARNFIVGASAILLIIFCLNNYQWNLPFQDFRPFKEGVDVYEQKQAEEEAAGSVQIVAWKLQNRSSGELLELENQEYMSNYTSYPKEEWEIIDQVKSEPAIPITKISDFEISATDGTDVTYDILEAAKPILMIVSYKLKGEAEYEEVQRVDSIFRKTIDESAGSDTVVMQKTFERLQYSQETVVSYDWDDDFVEKYTGVLKPFVDAAAADGVGAFVVVGGADASMLEDFAEVTQLQAPFYEADDIMLKTIIRSNPGVVLLNRGQIVKKWHISKLPDWSKAKGEL